MKIRHSAIALAVITATSSQVYANNLDKSVADSALQQPKAYYRFYPPISGTTTNANTTITRTVTEIINGVTTKTVYKTVNGQTTITKTVTEKDGTITTTITQPNGSSSTTVKKPGASTTEPPANTTQPVTEPTKPVTEPEKPVTEPTKPVTEPEKPVTEPTKPVTEPTKPVTEPETPVTEPTKPVTEPEKPVTEPTKPVTEPEKPVTEPTKPVTEPEKPTTDPVDEKSPTTEPPVVEPVKPVVEPIADNDTPSQPSLPIVIKPTDPSSPTTTIVATNVPTSGVAWNDKRRGYDKNDPNNKKNVTLNGSGVTVAILDSGFNNSLMKNDISTKFGSRQTTLNTGRYAPSNAIHGIEVAEMVAGNTSNGIAPNANLLLADITYMTSSGKSAISATADIYKQLWNGGARIFNQSFGIDSQVTEFNKNTYSSYYYANQFQSDILSFYRDAVKNGGLFVWAAGNERYDADSSLQAGLPYFETSLEPGWISAVALATRTSSGLGNFDWSNLLPLSKTIKIKK